MADLDADNGNSISSGGMTGDHPVFVILPFKVASSTESQFNTVRLPLVSIACWNVEDVRFAFDSSFVDADCAPQKKNSPEDIRRELKALKKLVTKYPGCPLTLFGHADPVGNDAYNKSLSERRARAIYSLLICKTEPETALSFWKQIATHEKWGKLQSDKMQSFVGIDSTGDALIKAYMDKLSSDGPSMAKTDFLAQGAGADRKGDFQGCSEFNPRLIFSQEKQAHFDQGKTKNDQTIIAARNDANRVNRRVLGVLLRKGSRVDSAQWPCPRAIDGVAGCVKRFWVNGETRRSTHLPNYVDRSFTDAHDTFACRFFQRLTDNSPCHKIIKSFQVRLYDPLGKCIPNAPYQVAAGALSVTDHADDQGIFTAHNIEVPNVCYVRWGYPPDQNSVASTPVESTSTAQKNTVDYKFTLQLFLGITDDDPDAAAHQRLNNLGYHVDPPEANVANFQRDYQDTKGLTVTGKLDQTTVDAIRDIHDTCLPDLLYEEGQKAE
jgi:hypothetical protein